MKKLLLTSFFLIAFGCSSDGIEDDDSSSNKSLIIVKHQLLVDIPTSTVDATQLDNVNISPNDTLFISSGYIEFYENNKGKWSITVINTNSVYLGTRETTFDWSSKGKKWLVSENDTGILAEITMDNYFTMKSNAYTFYFY